MEELWNKFGEALKKNNLSFEAIKNVENEDLLAEFIKRLGITDILELVPIISEIKKRRGFGGVSAPLVTKQSEQEAFLQKIAEIKLCEAPSSFGINWNDKNGQEKLGYRCHRPSCYYGAHVSVFSSVFDEFRRLLTEIQPTETDSQFVLNLCNSMTQRFLNEEERVVAFSKQIASYLGYPFQPMFIRREKNRPINNDGACLVPIGTTGDNGLALSIEAKPEIGQGKCCAFMEGVAYHAIWAVESGRKVLDHSCCPAFLCLLTGPFFQGILIIIHPTALVSGTVFVDNIHCDPLTAAYPLFVLPYDMYMMMAVTRCFAALKTCVLELIEYYRKGAMDSQPRFPYCNSISNLNLSWKYIKPLHPRKQVWLAETQSGQKLVIKWTQHITPDSLDAWKACSEAQICPSLIGYQKSGTWLVTVSVWMEAETLDTALTILSNKPQRLALIEKVKNLVTMMHKVGYVHGDLRGPNILVTKERQILFVDFDYAGKFGSAKYPHFLNKEDLKWPAGADAGAVIHQDHDFYWLKLLEDAVLKC